jgi:hypothetical protein
MSDTLPGGRTARPEYADPDERELERREHDDERELEQREEPPEPTHESTAGPGAGPVSEAQNADATGHESGIASESGEPESMASTYGSGAGMATETASEADEPVAAGTMHGYGSYGSSAEMEAPVAAEQELGPEPDSPSMAEPGHEPEPQTPSVAEPGYEPEAGPVLAPEATSDFRVRWSSIQAEFIDDPRHAVEDADRFVADVAQAFASGMESRRRALTSAWEQAGHGETEELRLTMQQYRVLVDRILLG